MKVICAPDKFKGSLAAEAAAQAMARGVRRISPEAAVDCCPVADGGEGTVEAMLAATQGRPVVTRVCGPCFSGVDARWGILGVREHEPMTAVIEMAAASGLVLVPPKQRDLRRTTTMGTGFLIKAALDAGAKRIILGIGGSATNDGGCGVVYPLGGRFSDRRGIHMVKPIAVGGNLEEIARIDVSCLDPRVAETEIRVACDVTNPLTGPDGAAQVYGPQKGATPEQVEQLDRGLRHLAKLIREQLGVDVEQMPGAGAAGGLGAGLVAFLGAKLVPGIQLVLEAVGFERRVAGCDLCLTGEGRIDGQTASGKACMGVAQAAARHGVKTIAIVGSVGPGAELTLARGLAAYYAIGTALPVEESMRQAAELIEQTTAGVVADCVAKG